MKKKAIPVLSITTIVLALIIVTSGCTLLGIDSGEDEMSKLNSSIAELTGGDFEAPQDARDFTAYLVNEL